MDRGRLGGEEGELEAVHKCCRVSADRRSKHGGLKGSQGDGAADDDGAEGGASRKKPPAGKKK